MGGRGIFSIPILVDTLEKALTMPLPEYTSLRYGITNITMLGMRILEHNQDVFHLFTFSDKYQGKL